jgi:hypothetical protein
MENCSPYQNTNSGNTVKPVRNREHACKSDLLIRHVQHIRKSTYQIIKEVSALHGVHPSRWIISKLTSRIDQYPEITPIEKKNNSDPFIPLNLWIRESLLGQYTQASGRMVLKPGKKATAHSLFAEVIKIELQQDPNYTEICEHIRSMKEFMQAQPQKANDIGHYSEN